MCLWKTARSLISHVEDILHSKSKLFRSYQWKEAGASPTLFFSTKTNTSNKNVSTNSQAANRGSSLIKKVERTCSSSRCCVSGVGVVRQILGHVLPASRCIEAIWKTDIVFVTKLKGKSIWEKSQADTSPRYTFCQVCPEVQCGGKPSITTTTLKMAYTLPLIVLAPRIFPQFDQSYNRLYACASKRDGNTRTR